MKSLGGPTESRCIDCGQRSKRNSRRVSGHSHWCLAPTPPISLLSEGVTPTNFDPRDIFGVYPKDFCTMAPDNDTTKEKVSASRQGSIPTRTQSRSHVRSRSAPRTRGQPVAPRAAAKSSKAAQQLILAILKSTTKALSPWQGLPATPPAPPLFSTIAAHTNSPTIAPVPLALASATVGMSVVVQKYQTNSLSLLRSSVGPGKFFESNLALLQKSNISLIMEAMAGVRAAGGTAFLLETLFKVARLEEKEAWQIFAIDRLVTSVATDAQTRYSSITDAEGFRIVSRHSIKFLSPPSKQ